MTPMSWQHRPRCDETPSWALLAAHHARAFQGPAAFDLRRAFAQDAQRVAAFSIDAPPVLQRRRVEVSNRSRSG